MSTIYNKLQNDFTIINNHIIQDNRVSGNAFKLYCYIVFRLGRNPEWEFISYEILTHFKEGKKALKTARDELINLGYLKCLGQKHRVNGDFGGNDYEIYSKPACYPEGSTLQRQTLEGSTHKGSTNKNEYNKTELKENINKNITTASGLSSLENSKPLKSEDISEKPKSLTTKEILAVQKQDIQRQFSEFWEAYGKKVKKPKAIESYQKALKQKDTTHQGIMNGVKKYNEYLNISGCFKADPTTWLNQGRWNDDYDDLIKQECKKNGKTPPVAQKSPEKQQEEVKMKEDTQKKVEAVKSRLNAKEKEFNDYIKEEVLENYFSPFHFTSWINNMSIKCRDEVATVGVFKNIDNQWQKLQGILTRELQSKGFEFEKIELKLID